jgi:hypothetical protein
MYKTSAFLVFLTSILLVGCQERGDKKSLGPLPDNGIYFDYQVMGEEGEDSVACRLQCRRGNQEGETVLLPSTTEVTLDGQPLQPDSAGFSGIYYETQRPAAGFSGQHTWQLKDKEGTIKANFSYFAFSLADLPPQVKRGDLELQLKNFPDDDDTRLHLLLVDTAWASNDLNALWRVRDGKLLIPVDRLSQLKAGPISLELRYEETLPLQPDAQRGSLHISYGLRRSFDLVD